MAAKKATIIAMILELDQEMVSICNDDQSSSSDDEMELHLLQTVLPTTRGSHTNHYIDEILPGYTDLEFKTHFRMLPLTFDFLLQMIQHEIDGSSCGRPSISPKKQLLMAIWILATPDSYRSITTRFGVFKSTLWRVAVRVWETILKHGHDFIKWPDESEKDTIAKGFKAICGFPDVIGCIDGCHINISAPLQYPESYINRKGTHSIILQAVCDHRCMFTDTYAGEVGSVHDARVFRRSDLGRTLNEKAGNKHILGDSAYPLSTHLLTPFRDNGHLTRVQRNYNYKHSKTRCTVERSFAFLKGRFRRLKHLDMWRTDLVPMAITVSCILHNICQARGDDLPADAVHDINAREELGTCEEPNPVELAQAKRQRIAEQLAH